MSKQQSLKRRLLVRLSGALVLVLTCGALGVFVVAQKIGTAVYDNWLYDSAMTLSKQITFEEGRPVLDIPDPAMEMFTWDRVDQIFAEVVSPASGRIYSNGAFGDAPSGLESGETYFYNGLVNGFPVRVVAILVSPAGQDETFLVQVAETERKRETLIAMILWLIVPLELIILLATGMAIWISVTSSLREVNTIAKQLADYDPAEMAPVDARNAPAEITPLISSLNALIAKLVDLQNSQRRFISDAAHQLRTPLAALQVQTERALREPDPNLYREALAQMLRALQRLRRVTNQLLTLARSNASQSKLNMVETDLVDLLRGELERATDAAIERNIDLGYEGPQSGVSVVAEPHLLREMVSNLIDNAIRYTQPGGHITVSVAASPLILTVDDDGLGIPADERERVLEPFYRVRGVTEDGCGLGLAIAHEIAVKHGANLCIKENPKGRGTRIEICFPNGDQVPSRAGDA